MLKFFYLLTHSTPLRILFFFKNLNTNPGILQWSVFCFASVRKEKEVKYVGVIGQ